MPLLTVASANINSPEWAELLVKSIIKFSSVPTEILIIDNASLAQNLKWLEKQKGIKLIKLSKNIGHGNAMDLATTLAVSPYICFLDIDSFVQRKAWDTDLIDMYDADKRVKLIGVRGPEHKPLHPPLFFYEKRFITENNIMFKYLPRVSTDTAQKAYWDIINLGFKVERLEKGVKVYPDCIGDEIYLADKPTFFHSWYGTRFNENDPKKTKSELDGYKLIDYLAEKKRVFKQPQVKKILSLSLNEKKN